MLYISYNSIKLGEGKKILEDAQDIYTHPHPPQDCVIGSAHCKSQRQVTTTMATGLGQWAGFSLKPAARGSNRKLFILGSRPSSTAANSLFLWVDRHVHPSQVSVRPFTQMRNRMWTLCSVGELPVLHIFIHSTEIWYLVFTNLQALFWVPGIQQWIWWARSKDMWALFTKNWTVRPHLYLCHVCPHHTDICWASTMSM